MYRGHRCIDLLIHLCVQHIVASLIASLLSFASLITSLHLASLASLITSLHLRTCIKLIWLVIIRLLIC